jgi:hypothetical protein
MSSKQKRKKIIPRNLVVLGMLLSCKGGFMHDRREPRGGARNEQQDIVEEYDLYDDYDDIV